jgi:murein L,D-transpeptidase YafK
VAVTKQHFILPVTGNHFMRMNLKRSEVTALIGIILIACGALAQSPDENKRVDRILILKSARTMTLESNGQPLKTYKVALGGQPIGAKQEQGDHKTPEGVYFVDAKNAHSQFYMALHLSYPNAGDKLRARKQGVSPGGDIEIHGLGKRYGWIGARHREVDWTDGCIAVTNEEIEEIFRLVPAGTRVETRP